MRARPRARSILSVGVGLVWTAVAVLLFIEGTVGLAVFFVILAVIQFAGAGNDRRDVGRCREEGERLLANSDTARRSIVALTVDEWVSRRAR